MINVFNIERFATHDGPGIRTVIFCQGCPLRCPWCSNPESQVTSFQILWNEKKCIHCLSCQNHCPTHSIHFDDHQFHLNQSTCQLHQHCVIHCPTDALSISGKAYTIESLIKEVLKDKAYYEQSNGGVTISGGEPLFQFDSLLELVKALKKEKLHIALETTGTTSLENLQQITPYTDLFLYDLKHIDPQKLCSISGNDEIIFRNLLWLNKNFPDKLVIRIPVIPTFNFDELDQLLDYCEAQHFKEVHLLPYHHYGENKYHLLRRKYEFQGIEPLTKEILESKISPRYSFKLIIH